jgi:uncharacterized protein (DUF2344 family)
MMDVDRMRRQREKHNDFRYRVWYLDQEMLSYMTFDETRQYMSWLINDFRIEVEKWNMWTKHPLSHVAMFRDMTIDINAERVIFEVQRLREQPIKEFW